MLSAARDETLAPDEIDGEARFVPIERVHQLPLSASQVAFLELALLDRPGA